MTNTPKKYSTPKKRLFELKKELRQLKRRMDKKVKISEKRGERPHSYALHYNDDTWSTIEIITSDNKMYTMDCTTIFFPDIDFRKIVYINKSVLFHIWRNRKTGVCYEHGAKLDSYDSLNGYYKGKYDYEYTKNIQNKFKVKEVIYTGLD